MGPCLGVQTSPRVLKTRSSIDEILLLATAIGWPPRGSVPPVRNRPTPGTPHAEKNEGSRCCLRRFRPRSCARANRCDAAQNPRSAAPAVIGKTGLLLRTLAGRWQG